MPQTFWFCTGQRSNNRPTRISGGHFMQSYKNINNKWGKIVSNKSQGVTESRWRLTKRLFTQDLNKVRAKVRVYRTQRNNCGKEGKSCTSQLIFKMWSQHGDFLINQGPADNKKVSYLTWETVRAHLCGCCRRADLSEVSRVSAPRRLLADHHVLCSHADAARWRRRAKRCTERSCSLSLHHCAAGGDLGAVLGWGSLHQTGRLWGTNADLKINKQIKGV